MAKGVAGAAPSENPVPLTPMAAMVSVAAPVLVQVTGCVELLPALTGPNASEAVQEMSGKRAGVSTLRLSARVAAALTSSESVAEPENCGASVRMVVIAVYGESTKSVAKRVAMTAVPLGRIRMAV